MALRERKKAALRDTLVRNAVALFEQRGFDEVSVEEICQVSMTSRSTFHRYFGSKEDLLFPTAVDRLSEMAAALDAVGPDDDAWLAAREAVSAGLRGFLDDLEPDLQAACVRLWFVENAPRRRYLEIVLEWEAVLAAYFAKRAGADPASNLTCRLLASAISSALRAAQATAMTTGTSVDAPLNEAFALLEGGLGGHLPQLAVPVPRRRIS